MVSIFEFDFGSILGPSWVPSWTPNGPPGVSGKPTLGGIHGEIVVQGRLWCPLGGFCGALRGPKF